MQHEEKRERRYINELKKFSKEPSVLTSSSSTSVLVSAVDVVSSRMNVSSGCYRYTHLDVESVREYLGESITSSERVQCEVEEYKEQRFHV